MIFKILVCWLAGGLFAWGGFNFKPARRFILPVILVGVIYFYSHTLFSFLCLLSIVAFSLGYGENSFVRHVFGNGWGRGVWGLLAAICLSLPLFLTHHLLILFFLGYLALNFTLENALKNINQIFGDIIIGMGFGSIVFLIK